MAQEVLPHKLTVDERQKLTLTGATEILRFDEETAVIACAPGTVVVRGQELKLKTLSLEGGVVCVTGRIDAVYYDEPKASGFWGRLMGG